jgi:hypothetical protein
LKNVFIEINDKGTLKAHEHDKYENIAGSVWLSLFMGSITQYLHQ